MENAKYDEEWVMHVLPGSISQSHGHFTPENCYKYVFKNDSLPHLGESCPAHWFDHEEKVKCDKWVFDKNERTIVNDVIAN